MLLTDRRIWSLLGLRPTGDLGPLTFYTTRHRRVVAFPRAPPLTPPSPRQTFQRNSFRAVAWAWTRLTPQRRKDWLDLAKTNHLRITGYNLYVYYQLTGDLKTIKTLRPNWPPPY